MITEDMVRSGIREHLITFIVDPNMGSGTVCSIGDSWFYFGGQEAEDAAPEESGDTSDAEGGEEVPEGGESSEDAGVSAPGEDSESGEEGENSGGSQEDTGSEAGGSEEAAGGSDIDLKL